MKLKKIICLLVPIFIIVFLATIVAAPTVTILAPPTATIENISLLRNFSCKIVVTELDNITIMNLSLWHNFNDTTWGIKVVNGSGTGEPRHMNVTVVNDTYYNFSQGIVSDIEGVWNCQGCINGTATPCAMASANFTYNEDSTPPTVIGHNPNGTLYSPDITFNYTPTDNNFGNCSFYITEHDSSVFSTDQTNTTITNATVNQFTKTISETGTYTYRFGCSDKIPFHTNSSSGTFTYATGAGVGGIGGVGGVIIVDEGEEIIEDIGEGVEQAVATPKFWIWLIIIIVIISFVWFIWWRSKK